MIRRRNIETFSLSFLDCICCGFGAIILIFVLTIGSRERVKVDMLIDLQRVLAAEMAALAKIRATLEETERSQRQVATLVVDARKTNDTVHAMLDDLERQIKDQLRGKDALLVDLDELKKEIAARQKKPEIELKDVAPTPVGLPVGSNYIAFVIDTSGSMRDPNTNGLWPIAIRKIEEILDSYPEVKGIQLLDSSARFIMGGRSGDQGWLPDTPEVRANMKRILRRYDEDGVSNPVPGVLQVFRRLYDPKNPDMKLCIFVVGDEFNAGDSAEVVIRRLDELNPADENGDRKVVINAIGFPTTIRYQFSMGNTGLRFANLMRTVCYQHGGAFIALQDL